MRIGLLVTMSLSLLLMTGCMSNVRTTTTIFHAPGHEARGAIFVTAADKKAKGSLEFQSYRSKIEAKLANNGYRTVNSANEADFIAIVSYGIDTGKTSLVSSPVFGQTGGGTTYSSGSVYGYGGSASYSGTSYTMPTYGIVGSATDSVTEYTRSIAIDILDAKSLKRGKVKKKYELRAKSTGSCPVIAEVFDEILEAMFKEFPGVSGKSRTIEVSGEFDC